MSLVAHLRVQARANRLANRRLHEAMGALPAGEFDAPRTGFFPSLAATLNHILAVDGYYLAALHGDPHMARVWDAFVPAADLAALAARQAAMDESLIAHCESLTEATAQAEVAMDRGTRIDLASAAQVLAHVFMHQTHHRGQAHAMLSGTAVAPPQLDEFLLASDDRFRVADLAALGWSEATLFGAGRGAG